MTIPKWLCGLAWVTFWFVLGTAWLLFLCYMGTYGPDWLMAMTVTTEKDSYNPPLIIARLAGVVICLVWAFVPIIKDCQ